MILVVKKCLEGFELQKTNQKAFRVEKVINRKGDKLYVKWKATIILLIVRSIKNILLYKISYFPEPYTRSKNQIKLVLDLSNYATKSDFKNTAGEDTSNCAKNLILSLDLKFRN